MVVWARQTTTRRWQQEGLITELIITTPHIIGDMRRGSFALFKPFFIYPQKYLYENT
jgi:hypothetical protein